MKVAFYEGMTDATPSCVEVSWEELRDTLTTFDAPKCSVDNCRGRDCPAKNTPAWSPVDIEGPRANSNVKAITACVLDLDHLLEDEFAAALARVAGVAGVVHTTHSHDPDAGDGSYRLVLELSRPAAPKEWPAVRRAVVARFDLQIDPGDGTPGSARGADPQTGDLSRLYFLPTRREGAPHLATRLEGAPLDVDALLASAPPPPAQPAAPRGDGQGGGAAEIRARVQQVVAAKLQGSPDERAQAELLSRVLSGGALAQVGARDATVLRVTGLLSHWLPAGTPWESVEALLRPSVEAMPCDPEGVDGWLQNARVKFERQSEHRRVADERRASDEAGLKELAARRRAAAARAGGAASGASGGGGASAGGGGGGGLSGGLRGLLGGGDDGGGDDWQLDLLVDGKGLRPCEWNARVLVACAPELVSTIRWDAVRRRIDVRGGPLAGLDEEVLPDACAGFLQKEYEFFGSAQLVGRAILRVALENQFDPLADMLDEFAWDGQPRADLFLTRYLGAPDTDYVRAVSRRWLVSLVARALSPGCKVDTVLILEGLQGVGKSSALEALVGQDFFLDTHLELGEKDAMMAIAGAWLIELGELSSLRKAEVEKTKNFVSSRQDKFRPPYGKTVITTPRRCVMVGTTNDDQYLRDPTGNRRYWPVHTPAPDVRGIRRDREQILAEAVAMFRAGERWWFEGDEKVLAASEAESREEGSTIEEAVARWWAEMDLARRPKSMTVLDIAEAALRLPVERVDRRVRSEIGHAMKRLKTPSGAAGFKARLRREEGDRTTRYEPTDEMLAMPTKRRFGAQQTQAQLPPPGRAA